MYFRDVEERHWCSIKGENFLRIHDIPLLNFGLTDMDNDLVCELVGFIVRDEEPSVIALLLYDLIATLDPHF